MSIANARQRTVAKSLRSLASARGPRPVPCLLLLVGSFLVPLRPAGAAEPAPASPEALKFFEKEIRPLLASRCFECHGDIEKFKGGLKLTSRASILAGGETGPAAEPGKPAKSLLI